MKRWRFVNGKRYLTFKLTGDEKATKVIREGVLKAMKGRVRKSKLLK